MRSAIETEEFGTTTTPFRVWHQDHHNLRIKIINLDEDASMPTATETDKFSQTRPRSATETSQQHSLPLPTRIKFRGRNRHYE